MSDRAGQHWDESRQAWMWNKPDDGTARIADLGAQLADCAKTCGGLEYRLEQAEAALAEREEESVNLLDSIFQTVDLEDGEAIVAEAFPGGGPEWVLTWYRKHPTEAEARAAEGSET